jgi:hypothetical protein
MKRIATTCFSLLLLAAMACAQVPKEYQPTQLRDFPRGLVNVSQICLPVAAA